MNHKARELILHFGLAKTGSTALQRVLYTQKQSLLKYHNTLYPGNVEAHHFIQAIFLSKPMMSPEIQRLNLGSEAAIRDFLSAQRTKLLEEINESKPERIIISSEYFAAMDEAELNLLRVLFESVACDIKLFGYVRNPWSFTISSTQEMIRAGYIAKNVKLDYVKSNIEILEKFESAFESVATVVPFIEDITEFDVVTDFCNRFGFYALVATQKADRATNRRMNLEATCAMLHLNELYPICREDGVIEPYPARDWMAEALQLSPLDVTPIEMNRATYQDIFDKCLGDSQMMNERYFAKTDPWKVYFKSQKARDFDDLLSISRLTSEEVSKYMLSSLKILADRAVHYYVESIFNQGKWCALSGDKASAFELFNRVLVVNSSHDAAKIEIEALKSARE